MFRKCLIVLAGAAALWCMTSQAVSQEGGAQSIIVGRIAHVEGELLRYVESEEDWVATVSNTPVAENDVFYSDEGGKAEFIFPNSTLFRVGDLTEIDIATLDRDLTEASVSSGIVRAYNTSADAVLRVETPFGYCLVPSRAVVDIYVGDESSEVIGIAGTADFVKVTKDGLESRYEVIAGSPSLVVDASYVQSGEGSTDPEWNAWCQAREGTWKTRGQVRSAHLPERLQEHAYDLEENGRWERVQYRGYSHWAWRPSHVEVGWAPYTVGRWTEWYNDQVWVPYEPWGWVTHHHGHWIQVGGAWWWTPYVYLGAPAVGVNIVGGHVGFGVSFWPSWHPGRVVWLSTHEHVGWAPLAPWETYYGWRRWGPRTVVVNNVSVSSVRIRVNNYAYIGSSIIVPHRHFYGVGIGGVRNYNVVRIRNVRKKVIINKYGAAPVFHKTVVKNYNRVGVRNRYNFVNKRVVRKPHHTVVKNIKVRKQQRTTRPRVKAAVYKEKVQGIQKGAVVKGAPGKRKVEKRTVTNKMVRAGKVNQPADQVKFKKQTLKAKKPKPEAAKRPAVGKKRPEAKKPAVGKKRPEAKKPAAERKRPKSKKPELERKRPEAKKSAVGKKRPEPKKPAAESKKPKSKKPELERKRPEAKKSAVGKKRPEPKKPAAERKKPTPQKPAVQGKRPKAKKPEMQRKQTQPKQQQLKKQDQQQPKKKREKKGKKKEEEGQ